jgi:predicted HTH domain antitoxin
MKATTVRLSEKTIQELEELAESLNRDRSDIIREALRIGVNEMQVRSATELYSKGKISFGRMAELTSLGYRELALELKRRNLPIRYGEERLREEINQPEG